MSYAPHQAYVDPARAAAEVWRTAAGAGMTVVAGFALYQFVYAIVSNMLGPDAMQVLIDATTFAPGTPGATLYTLFAFGFFAVGLALVVRGIHRRSPRTLIGPWRGALRDFRRTVLAVGALLAVLGLLLPHGVELVRNPAFGDRGDWLRLLPLGLAAILVQSGTEEAFFRGYLQQQLAARFAVPALWLPLPSALFGLAHYAPAMAGPNAAIYAIWAFLFGLAAADLTARTGTIGAAVGLHVANNLAAILLVSPEGNGSGLALYHLPMSFDDPALRALLLPELLMLLCSWLTARLVLRV